MRLTINMGDGTYRANNDTEFGGENSFTYKDAVIEKLGKYEDQFENPDLLKALTFCCCVERQSK